MKQLKLNANTFGDEEITSITDVLRSGHMTMGAETAAFEDEFARYLGVGNAVMVNFGSSANLLAFFALANPLLTDRRERLGLGPGDEVIVPALTWPTTIWPIIQAGMVEGQECP